MKKILTLATEFEKQSKQSAENTEKAVSDVFRRLEATLTELARQSGRATRSVLAEEEKTIIETTKKLALELRQERAKANELRQELINSKLNHARRYLIGITGGLAILAGGLFALNLYFLAELQTATVNLKIQQNEIQQARERALNKLNP